MNCFYLWIVVLRLFLLFFLLVFSSNSLVFPPPPCLSHFILLKVQKDRMAHSSRLLQYTIHGNVFITHSTLNPANFISYAFYLLVPWLALITVRFDRECVRFSLVCSISHAFGNFQVFPFDVHVIIRKYISLFFGLCVLGCAVLCRFSCQ